MTTEKKGFRADGGDMSIGRIREIADDAYGDEEKRWLAKTILARASEKPAAYVDMVELRRLQRGELDDVAIFTHTLSTPLYLDPPISLEASLRAMNAVVTAASLRGIRPFESIECDPPTLEENAEACGDAMSARIRELEANPPKSNGLAEALSLIAILRKQSAEWERKAISNFEECARLSQTIDEMNTRASRVG